MSNLPDVPPIGFLGRTRKGDQAIYLREKSGYFIWSLTGASGEYAFSTPYRYGYWMNQDEENDIVAPWDGN